MAHFQPFGVDKTEENTRLMNPTEVHKLIKAGYWFHFREQSFAFPTLEVLRGEPIINGTHIKFYDGFSIGFRSKLKPLTMKR